MAELKTKSTNESVTRFLDNLPEARRRRDCYTLLELMQQATKSEPRMWGSSIVGFGTYHFHYDSGREGDWFLVGFSPRKQSLTLYVMSGFDQYENLLGQLGKHSVGKSCLYIKKMDDIDLPTLKKLIQHSVKHMQKSSVR